MSRNATMWRARDRQRGSVLLPVVVAITLLAAITFMLSYQGVSQTTVVTGEAERDRLRYVAEAGLAHARSQLARNTSCDNYADIPKTDFAGETYSVAVSPSKGSPIKIKSSVELQNGKKLNINAAGIRAYQPATTVVLQLSDTSGEDTILDDFYPIRNYGGASYLQVNSGSWKQRPVLRFPLDKIPANATIQLARLELRQWNANVPGEITVHRLTRDWVEGTRNGGGIADGATWETHDGASSWSQPGGEYDPTVYSARYVTSGGVGGWDQWDITDLVQEWVSGTIPNYGLLLLGDGTVSNVKWASRDTNNPPDAPKLTIVYACECGKTCGAALPTGKTVLLVVADPVNMTVQDTVKQTLIEGWGHTVNLIDDDAAQAEFDAAYAVNDVVYMSEQINSGTLSTKLRNAYIGVVFEEQKIPDELGVSSGESVYFETAIDITDNTHYITEPFSTGALTIVSSSQEVGDLGGTLAPDLQILAQRPSSTRPTLAFIEAGGALFDGGTADGRRVKVPWGGNTFDTNALTADGQTIMKRAIEWGAGANLSGPIAHWKLDETTGFTAVDSVGGNDGTLQNGAAWTTGQIDGGLDFDGVDDAVSAGAPATLDDIFDGGGTLTAWMHPDGWGEGNYGRIADKSSATYPGNGWALELYGGNSSFLFQTGYSAATGSWTTPNGSVSLGAWQHVALVYDTSSDANDPRIFIDGVEQTVAELDTPSGTLRSDTGVNFTIGNHAMSTVRTFDGQLDDVRVYGRMLSAAEIAKLATPPSTAPIAHWKFDETSGTTAIDSEGGHDGTLVGNASWAPGEVDGSLSLDGTGDRVDVSGLIGSPSSLTIAAWVNLSSAGFSGAEVIDLGDNILMRLDNTFYDTYVSFWDGSSWQRTRTGQFIAGSGWRHVAYTHDDAANQQYFYIDGVEAASTTFSTSISYSHGSNTTIGANSNGNSNYDFNGQIDDLRIYNVALSAAEIAELAAMGGSGGGGGDPSGGGITFEEFTDASLGSDGLSITIAKPAGTGAGDLLIATVVTDGENKSAITAPAGWTLIDHDSTSKQVTMDVLWKIAGASEPGSYDFSWAKAQEAYGWIMRFTGHDPASPIHQSSNTGGSSNSPLSPAVTTTIADTMIVRIAGFDDDDISPGNPGLSGHTAITMGSSGTGVSTASGGAGYLLQTGTGSSGPSTFSLTGSEEYRAVTIAIAPAP